MNPIPNILPANRIAAIATWLAGLAAVITALIGVFPHAWQNYALAASGLLTKLIVTLQFMSGSQKYDKIVADHSTSLNADQALSEIDGTGPSDYLTSQPESAIKPDAPQA